MGLKELKTQTKKTNFEIGRRCSNGRPEEKYPHKQLSEQLAFFFKKPKKELRRPYREFGALLASFNLLKNLDESKAKLLAVMDRNCSTKALTEYSMAEKSGKPKTCCSKTFFVSETFGQDRKSISTRKFCISQSNIEIKTNIERIFHLIAYYYCIVSAQEAIRKIKNFSSYYLRLLAAKRTIDP
jgi:hypothetical protein